jgi:putative phosphoribosyl transferase
MERTMFVDRNDAGRQIGERLRALDLENPVLLAIPRGGIPIAVVASLVLDGADVGVIVARKLGAPGHPELAIGAVTANGAIYLDHDIAKAVRATDEYIEKELRKQRREALRRETQFDGHRSPPVSGRTVVILDDGVATGATAIAAVRAVRAAGAERVIFAVPVGPTDTLDHLRLEADEVVSLYEPEPFWSVGQYYQDFSPVDSEVARRMLYGARVSPKALQEPLLT